MSHITLCVRTASMRTIGTKPHFDHYFFFFFYLQAFNGRHGVGVIRYGPRKRTRRGGRCSFTRSGNNTGATPVSVLHPRDGG